MSEIRKEILDLRKKIWEVRSEKIDLRKKTKLKQAFKALTSIDPCATCGD